AALAAPVNALEREEDPDGVWRAYVNNQLDGPYQFLIARLQDLILLEAPSFEVVAELKRLYPEELKRFCFEEQTKQARTQFVNDQLLESLNSNNPPPPMSFQVSPAIKSACAADKK
ncbi:MAG: hypothetical protein ACXU8S_09840, partial [Phenylobacterium sp.]